MIISNSGSMVTRLRLVIPLFNIQETTALNSVVFFIDVYFCILKIKIRRDNNSRWSARQPILTGIET